MAETVNNNSASQNKSDHSDNVNSDRTYTFVNLKNKTRLLQSVVKDGVICDGRGGATSGFGGVMSNLATSQAGTSFLPPNKRFAKATAATISAMKERRFEEKTVKNTKWGVKIFSDWLIENELDSEFEKLLPSELDILLAQFYVEVRKLDLQYYSKTSYTCIRAAIQRHLQNPPWNVTYCILQDSIFLHSNQVLKGVFKTLTDIGASVVNHHKSIEAGDLDKLRKSGVMSTKNPRALQNLVWLSIALQFGKRGRESYRSMSKDTFRRGTDDSGSEFYEYAVCESQKNHSGNNLASTYKPQGRMHACPGDPLCPVAAMDKYLPLLHPGLHCLWQKPRDTFKDNDAHWYCKAPIGDSTIAKFMKSMSVDAKLSQIYTNHCTRATVSKALSDANFDRSDIVKITGHKDTRSLDTYIGDASSNKKRALSDTLSQLVCHKRSQHKMQVVTDCTVGESGNSDTLALQKQDTANSTEGHSGINKDVVAIHLNVDHQNEVFESYQNFEEEFECNMIKSAEATDYKQSKRSLIFNNCVFKKNNFN